MVQETLIWILFFFGKQIFNKKNLIIPHPRAAERDFVLYPILDIDPFFRHPLEKKSIKVLSRELQNKYIICLLYTSPSPRDPVSSRMPSSA